MYSPCNIIQLALQKKKIYFLCLKISFFHHPKVFISVKLPAHLHFFSRYFFAANFFLMLGGCYCRLPARMFIWLVVESISI